ncbi:MAG: FeoB-associated Cys-rich membrane protein [Candidatus Delongbacteria bacterium]|nr:FeoB-associated Cys-rich membrane protein [Candidatus Delongbacteria bacterium]
MLDNLFLIYYTYNCDSILTRGLEMDEIITYSIIILALIAIIYKIINTIRNPQVNSCSSCSSSCSNCSSNPNNMKTTTVKLKPKI